ncbi:SUKH-4 family immunity protein [Streptomyces sp. NRRL F-5727]|uniref:SUKH-4 family immunity protein n=1 Tax=Streptomyces sp. NRRL F-5727 TaxID=1463871 RepID=UPI0004C50117|nr:SUKH-4 family immunity protein [Streptomyces sp. NRRL F-5727]
MAFKDRLVAAFPDDDFTVGSPDSLPPGIVDHATVNLLLDVGFPEHVVSLFFFEDLEDGLETLGDFRNSPTLPESLSRLYLIGVSDLHSACLDGESGKCYFVPKGMENSFQAASTLKNFLEFMADLNEAILSVHPDSSDASLDQLEDALVSSMYECDLVSLNSSEGEWRKLIRRSFGFVM